MAAGKAKEFVLVHGACHGAWCWDDVGARLRRRGHRVVAVDLPGHRRRAAEGPAARLGVRPVDMDTAHDPMLSDPDGLAAVLERIAG
jgi:pimeloyl-ACP methyl ester carboxylesterase